MWTVADRLFRAWSFMLNRIVMCGFDSLRLVCAGFLFEIVNLWSSNMASYANAGRMLILTSRWLL